MTAWASGDPDLDRVQCDLGFTEAINQSMQIPSRLKVADEATGQKDAEVKEDPPPPSFQMHIPDRISFSGMTDVSLRPFLLDQVQQNSLVQEYEALDHATVSLVDSPFLKVSTKSGTPNHRRVASQKRSKRQRTQIDHHTPLAVCTVDHSHDRQEISPARFPAFAPNGKIYSLQNVCRTVRFLGCLLSHRLQESLHSPSLPSVPALMENGGSGPAALGQYQPLSWPQLYSLQEMGVESSDGPGEELGTLEVEAIRTQINKISGRLQILEEERRVGHQKEVLVYSVLLAACLVNTWLWLRR
ncbi:mitochondrial fission factor homolog A-like isoform X1 [Rhinatrema bivittatum]|uniref:mitochondrial fission factor homolog A-like isoform X1 n=1 Tax=Rhinatrema bivittatum TaxID=194408 RepID=UPI00112C7122|nr:mitochondrial fission factor homolog A-like isoform X1 [Rhinatrema bivittatum]